MDLHTKEKDIDSNRDGLNDNQAGKRTCTYFTPGRSRVRCSNMNTREKLRQHVTRS